MKNIWGIFCRDIEKLTESVVPVIVIIGLCLVPCLYAWFNIMSNADPYGPASTSNIKVVVATEDKGSDLLGLELNIGDMVIDGIKGNDQMGWCFVDTREEAMDGLYAGDYYAALIVPKDFTKNFLSILDGDLVHPEVEYYENEKKNAIAPKITNKAKTAVQEQINSTIVSKVADSLKTISSIFNALGLDSDDIADGLTEKMDSACEKLDTMRKLMRSVKVLAADTQNLLEVGAITLDDAEQVMIDGGAVSHQAGITAGTIYDSSVTSEQNILNALNDIDQNLADTISLFGAWAGDPQFASNVAGYLYSASNELYAASDLLTGIDFPSVDLNTVQNNIVSMRELLNNTTDDAFSQEYLNYSGPTVTALNNYSADANAAANAIANASTYANAVYNDLASGIDPSADFNALYSELITASGYTDMSYELSLYNAAVDANNFGDFGSAMSYINDLSLMLDSKYSLISEAAGYIDSAYSDVAAAQQLVYDYQDKRAFYDQTLVMIQANIDALVSLKAVAPATSQAQIQAIIDRLSALYDTVKTSGDPANAESFIAQANEIRQQLREAALSLNSNVNGMIQDAAQQTQETMASMEELMIAGADGAVSLADTMQRFAGAMASSQLTIDEAIELSDQVYDYVKSVADDVRRMVNSEAFHQMMDVLENNPDGLADYLVSPVDMRTVIVYEIADYGSAMSPYYIMLALFVGSLLSVAMIKPLVPYPEFANVPQIQKYFGRLLLFLFIGMFQALVTSLGCLFYVKIQCLSPFLFVLGCMIISLNFMMMNYSFSYALDNVGLAASVIIMVIQVAGSGGSYPIHVLPQIFQDLYAFMPFHYGMDLVRECVGGFYQGTYLKCVLILLLMCVIFFVIGITLYYPAKKLNEIIAKSKEASGVM